MKRAWSFSLIVFATVIGVTCSSCSKGKPAPQRTVPVVAGSADQKNIPLQLKIIGNVEAYNAVSIKATGRRRSGRCVLPGRAGC